MSVVPDSFQHPAPVASARLRACAGECAWVLVAALAATVALALFVLVTEPPSGEPLLERMLRPINLLRLVVMTGCLALWGYILRAAERPTQPL